MADLVEARVELSARIDPSDIVTALNNNDDQILTFICQTLALAHSSDLRERLKERLTDGWSDEEYVE